MYREQNSIDSLYIVSCKTIRVLLCNFKVDIIIESGKSKNLIKLTGNPLV